MIKSSRELADFKAKKEVNTGDGISKASSSSTPWSRSLKDPRIVRVSRAFGGKDRHSKVCTVRGLRDRRVRLSVPTAIQLYDLQDRLGLNQPSKVVDWLLNAAKNDIDELPPLQMPPGNFEPIFSSSHGVGDPLELSRTNYWSLDAKSKEVDKENWIKRNEEGKQGDLEVHGGFMSSNQIFSRPNYSSLPNFLNNAMPHGSFLRWEPSNLSLSHLAPQTEDLHNFNVVPLPPTLSMPSGSQLLVYPHGTTQSYFPSHNISSMGEFDPKQINFQMLSSSSQYPLSNSATPPLYAISQGMRPFHLSMNPKLFPFQNNSSSGSEPNKEN